MPTLQSIEEEIKRLTHEQARELQDWLAEFLDSQEELHPDFVSAIERGKKDLQQNRVRTV